MLRREIPAAAIALSATAVLVLLIYLGSRGFKDFDSALIGYAVGSVFAFAAVVYRYSRHAPKGAEAEAVERLAEARGQARKPTDKRAKRPG